MFIIINIELENEWRHRPVIDGIILMVQDHSDRTAHCGGIGCHKDPALRAEGISYMEELFRKICVMMIAAVLTISQMTGAIPVFAEPAADYRGNPAVTEEPENDGNKAVTQEAENVSGFGSGTGAAAGDRLLRKAGGDDDLQQNEPLLGASTTVFQDDACATLNDPDTTYVLQGGGSCREDGNYFTVSSGASSAAKPLTIILDNVNRSQDGKSPNYSFITIESGNYVIIKLKGQNYIRAGEDKQIGSNDGMAGIHVANGSTVKVTSVEGDGSLSGSLEVHGGGGKYGGAGIGTRYNDDSGTIIIAGGTINAYGGHCAPGIGSGRDGRAFDIQITGGRIYAEGGEYAPGIGGGDHVGGGAGGNLVDLSITGGNITARGGAHAAGIGCSEGANLEGSITIENAVINATGGTQGAGIGGGDGAEFASDSSEIKIKSGKITATGGDDGAGIGGGNHTHNVRVTIDQEEGKDLEINAAGGKNAAGIGAGDEDGDYVDIALRGGSITARGGNNGAGIGAGDNVNRIMIKGRGTIKAYGGKTAAGIGGGNDSTVKSTFLIEGESDNTDKEHGSRGDDPNGTRCLDITAVASDGVEPGGGYDNEGAAIGGGKSKCADITIRNAVLHTRADEQGADIGGGGFHAAPDASGVVDTITIENCEIVSSSQRKVAPGIGAGYGGSVNHINIKDTYYTGGGIGGSIMDRNYRGLNSVDTIKIENSHIEAKWDEEHPGHCQSEINVKATPLDHGAAGIGSGQFGSIDDITIKDSYINASGYGSGAGIGGGGAGGQNWSVLALDKYDIGDVGTIYITGSEVHAKSGCARFTTMPSTTINDGYSDFEIDPIKFGGGAGIGSGSASGVEKIYIKDCDTVTATGYKGSGIGGGCATGVFLSGWVDSIHLENIGWLNVSGGKYCAGIGTGGGDGIRSGDSCVLKDIYMKNVGTSTVNHSRIEGGYGAAGVGLGYTSRYKTGYSTGDKVITIIDSSFTASGGKFSAGIGGSCEENLTGYGGDSPPILIKGKCRITANGGGDEWYEGENGSYGGGAGIGGGNRGGASLVEIDLPEDENTAKGTFDNPEASTYYVCAKGGSGAAGIGSGGSDWVDGQILKGDSDSERIIIKGGAVFARGGDSTQAGAAKWHGDFYKGAGAGIGGGNGESNSEYIFIDGGYVVAEAGAYHNDNDKAHDIGAGGGYSKDNDNNHTSGYLKISDGTVLAQDFGDFSDGAFVYGGSVSGIVRNAKNAAGRNVYRTTARLTDSPQTHVSISVDQDYAKDHIYSDPERRLYFYLYEKGSMDDKSRTADITVPAGSQSDSRHYYGYTDTDHTGVIKMETAKIGGHVDKVPIEGDDFYVYLDDDGFPSGTKWYDFKVQGDAELIKAEKDTSTGAKLRLHALREGNYTATGLSDYTAEKDSEIYWNSEFEFTDRIKRKPYVNISGDLSKVFDGNSVKHPDVSTNSDAKPPYTYSWFYTDGTRTPNLNPHTAGDYYVYVTVPETEKCGPAQSEKLYFSIIKAPTSVTQNLKMEDGRARITANVSGLISRTGSVRFTVKKQNEAGSWDTVLTKDVEVIKDDDDNHFALLETGMVDGGDYEVSVQYLENTNYQASNVDTKDYHKDPVAEDSLDITGKKDYSVPLDKDNPLKLDLSAVPADANVKWESEIVSDSADTYGLEKTAEIDAADPLKVIMHHAGTVTVRVTVSDTDGKLYPASVLVTVNIEKIKLYARPFMISGSHVTEWTSAYSSIDYGYIDGVNYQVLYTKGNDSSYYSLELFGDIGEHIGSVEAIPIDTHASPGNYDIGSTKKGEDITAGGKEYHNVFLWRDYDVETRPGHITVNPASIVICADTTHVRYGDPEPEYTWSIDENAGRKLYVTGLAKWDTKDDVFDENGAQIAIDPWHVDYKAYKDIAAGSYKNALVINGTMKNYRPVRQKWPYENQREDGFVAGNLIIDRADITDSERFDIALKCELDDDGNVKDHKVTVTDRKCFGKSISLVEGTDFTHTFDNSKQEAVVTGQGNYTGTVTLQNEKPKQAIRITTESAAKLYDGDPLTAGGTITGVRDEDRDKVQFTVTGSQTEAGKSRNTYTLSFTDEAVADKYEVTEEKLGTLTVVSNEIRHCSVSQPEDTVYNGKEQRQPVKITDGLGNVLTEDTDYDISYVDRIIQDRNIIIDESKEIKDAGVVTVTITGKGRYQGISSVKYAIEPAPLRIVTDSASKKYDGDPLTAGGEMTGLVNGESAELVTTGSITDPGTVANTYEIRWNGTAGSHNYYKSFVEVGELRVEPADGEQNALYAEGYEGTYDGKVHAVSAAARLEGSAITYSTDNGSTWTDNAPEFTDATDGAVSVLVHAENSRYEKGTADATVKVTIDRAPLSVKTGSAQKVHDGTPLTADGEMTGLVNGETADFKTTGSQTDAGFSTNTYEINWTGTANENNYEITKEELGILTVTEFIPEAASITINRDLSKVYDRTAAALSTNAGAAGGRPDISVSPESARNALTVTYKDASGTVMNEAPAEPGRYTVTASVADSDTTLPNDEQYRAASDSADFSIEKYRSYITITAPGSVVDEHDLGGEGVETAWTVGASNCKTPVVSYEGDSGSASCTYEEKQADGTYKIIDAAPSKAGEYRVTVNAPETAHYTPAAQTAYFRIAARETQLSVSVESKTYDGIAVKDPVIECNRDDLSGAAIQYYVKGSEYNTWDPINGKPIDAGSYKAVVTLPASAGYSAASSEAYFTISRRKIVVDTTAKYDNDVAVVVLSVQNGLDELQGRTVSIKISRADTGTENELSNDLSRELRAVFEFTKPDSTAYTVTPEFDAGSNYEVICNSRMYDINKLDYSVKVEDSTVELYSEPFDLDIKVKDSEGKAVGEFEYDYEIAEDPGSVLYDRVISVTKVPNEPNGRLKVEGAGTVLVKVTVKGDKRHNDGVGYAHVTVNKGRVTIKVSANDKTYDGKPAAAGMEMTYENDHYPVTYSQRNVTLYYYEEGMFGRVGKAAETAPKNAGSYVAAANAEDDMNFIAYDTEAVAPFEISPAEISVSTGSASKHYDGKPLTCSKAEISGIIVSEHADITATGSQTEIGQSSNTYRIRWAEDDPQRATASGRNYTVAEENLGTLEVLAPEPHNSVTAEGYEGIYDAKEHVVTAEALLDGSVIKFSTDGGKTWQNTSPAFKDVTDGSVTVNVRAENPAYTYGTAETSVQVKIDKAPLSVKTESASKTYDGKPLTAGGTLTGLLGDETAGLKMTGEQTEVGSSPNTYEIGWDEDDPDKASAHSHNYYVKDEDIGELTVTEPEIAYVFTAGEDSEWTKGSGKDLGFTVERSYENEKAFDHFTGIMVDDKETDKDCYTAVSGSVKLSFKADYLSSLSAGTHTLKAVFDDGEAETEFTIKEAGKPDDPDKPDKPDNPDDPDDPGDDDDDDPSVNPGKDDNDDPSSGPGNNSGGGSGGSNIRARTGDDSMLMLWICALVISAALLLAIAVIRYFRKE